MRHQSSKHNLSGKLLTVHNIMDTSTNAIINTLKSYNKQNTRISKPNIHISLNFHKDENIADEKMISIANDYMKDMGYGDQPFAIFRHYDREHPHIHITSTRVDSEGKKIKDSFEKYKSVRITEKLENKYRLTVAKKSKGYKEVKEVEKEVKNYLETGRGSLTNIISNAVDYVLGKTPTSLKQYDHHLNKLNIVRNSTTNDVDIYSVKNDDGEPYRNIIGSKLYNKTSTERLNKTLEENDNQKKKLHKSVMGRVYSVSNPLYEGKKKISLTRFSILLKRKGIWLEVKRRGSGEEKGKINGYIFIDKKSNQRYTATDFKMRLNYFETFIKDDGSKLIDNKLSKEYVPESNKNILEAISLQTFSSDEYQEDLAKKKRKKRKGIL